MLWLYHELLLLKVSFPKLKFDELGKQLVIFIDLLVIL